MFGINGGGKAFSTAEQLSSLDSDRSNNLSAADQEKAFGGEKNVGDFLNKLVDPNHTVKKVRNVGKSNLGKDDFLKLMLAQLQNQDPTNTKDSHEMAAQMAQFTSLEQLSNINKGIENLGARGNSGGQFEALNFIGKVASGDSSKLFRGTTDEKHDFNFELMADAADVKVEVKNAQNETIKTLTLKDLKKGKNSISWNGLTEDGFKSRPGEYNFQITAESMSGKKIHAETKFDGKISGVQFTGAGPVLLVGNQTVKLSDVRKIVDPSVLTEGQNTQAQKTLDLSQGGKKGETDKVSKAPVQSAEGNVGNLAMNRQFLEQVNKAKKPTN